jgi:multisubunit Na+/H+ antiporter MnhE subunit
MKASKTWWSEKWLVGGTVQVVRVRIVEDSNYDETTVMYIHAIDVKEVKPRQSENRVAQLAQKLKAGLTF